MPTRTGDSYRRGFMDGRSIWFRGQEIRDVATHPAFRQSGCDRRGIRRGRETVHAWVGFRWERPLGYNGSHDD